MTDYTSAGHPYSKAGIMIRESPTLASTGRTTIATLSDGYLISSFFDVFTEVSLDGGMSWNPAAGRAGRRATMRR